MTQTLPFERRSHTRAPIVRACKVRPAGAIRFEGGRTTDASWSGVGVLLFSKRDYRLGDVVDLIVAWDDEPIAQQPPTRATVRRVLLRPDGERRIGLEIRRDASGAVEQGVSAA